MRIGAVILPEHRWPEAGRRWRRAEELGFDHAWTYDHLAEFVGLTDLLLREPATSSTGRFYSAHEARMIPGCVQQPRVPFAIAAFGPRAMRVAAMHGEYWVTVGDPSIAGPLPGPEGAAVVAERMRRLDDVCSEVGRDPATLRRLVLTGVLLAAGVSSVESFTATRDAYESVGVTDLVVHWPRRDGVYAGDEATFETICSEVLQG